MVMVCQAAQVSLLRTTATGCLTGVDFRNEVGEQANQGKCRLAENSTPPELHANYQALLGLAPAPE